MTLLILYILAVTAEPSLAQKVLEANTNASESGFIHNWGPTLAALIVSLSAGFWSWWKSRDKTKHDQFQVFMDESSEFREEMRKERDRLKKEVIELEAEKLVLKKQINEYNIQLEDCANKVKKADIELQDTKRLLEVAQEKLGSLKEQTLEEENKR